MKPMALKVKIQENLMEAVKKKKELESLVLRQVSAAILNKEKEKRYKLSREKPELGEKELEKESQLIDEEVIGVIFSEVKKRKEAILEFSAYANSYGGPAVVPPSGGTEAGKKEKIENLIKKEKAELGILEKYLPEQLSEEEIRKLVKETIAGLQASLTPEEREKFGVKDMGKVMAEIMPKLKGKAEGSLVGKVVKELLIAEND